MVKIREESLYDNEVTKSRLKGKSAWLRNRKMDLLRLQNPVEGKYITGF